MRVESLNPGDLIECKVRGVTFEAIFRSVDADGSARIEPSKHWVTWKRVRPRQVVKKLERQERLGVSFVAFSSLMWAWLSGAFFVIYAVEHVEGKSQARWLAGAILYAIGAVAWQAIG